MGIVETPQIAGWAPSNIWFDVKTDDVTHTPKVHEMIYY